MEITLPKKDAAIRLTITNDEVVALVAAVENMHPPRKTTLARAMVYTLVFTGIRFQEWLDLKVGDILLADDCILIANGKGGKSRKVYPPKECIEAIASWIDVRGNCTIDWLWAYVVKSIRCQVHFSV